MRCLRANTDGKNWPTRKYEIQIENTERMARIFGANHDLDIQLTQKVLKPTGEWNEYQVTAKGAAAASGLPFGTGLFEPQLIRIDTPHGTVRIRTRARED